LQLEALTFVRPIEHAWIWARDGAKAAIAARELTQLLGFPVEAAASAQSVCAEADIIVTTTPAETPILHADWLRPGQHITAMGSDSEHKNEIDAAIFARAIYTADCLVQTRRLGELNHAIRAGFVASDRAFPELGQVIAGLATGRESDASITLCDLTGTGVQDTAIANLAHRRAVEAGAGRAIDTQETAGDHR
jgi:ornithine cyclodeaminase